MTKNGNIINAPKWFTQKLPPFALDGELWSKRGDFENIQSIVLDKKPSKKWNEITYQIFEVPNQDGNFTQRLQLIKEWLDKKPVKHLKIIKQTKCENRNQLEQFLEKIEKLGGEGAIVKNPKPSYFAGKSTNILKVKKFDDMEGKVINVNPGKGKFKNIMGSLTVELDNGTIFKLGGGFSIYNRKNPPDIGSIITFKYYGFTKNKKPRFASFLRVRETE